jgi:hypothetical protein
MQQRCREVGLLKPTSSELPQGYRDRGARSMVLI